MTVINREVVTAIKCAERWQTKDIEDKYQGQPGVTPL